MGYYQPCGAGRSSLQLVTIRLSWLVLWGYGEIGKHARFRFWCREVYGFDSHYPYHRKAQTAILFWNQLLIDKTKTVLCKICWCGGKADAADSKSVGRNTVWVQVPPPAPYEPVVQWNRTIGYEPIGREFKSLQAYQAEQGFIVGGGQTRNPDTLSLKRKQ